MDFAVANISVSPFIPPLVAFVISFFCSMGGITGAFLLLPFQISYLGYTDPSVSATNHVFNVVAVPVGVMRLAKEKRVVWPLVVVLCAGTLPGVFIGALVRLIWLPDISSFKLFAGIVLAYIGSRLLLSAIHKKRQKKASGNVRNRMDKRTAAGRDMRVSHVSWSLRRIQCTFRGEKISCSTVGLSLLSFVIGCIGGTYGIGGGAIIAPFLIIWFGLPVHLVSGASLIATLVTSIAGVSFYIFLAPFFPEMSVAPDWLLGSLFGIGGIAGVYCGVRCQKYLPELVIQIGLGILIVVTACQYIGNSLGWF